MATNADQRKWRQMHTFAVSQTTGWESGANWLFIRKKRMTMSSFSPATRPVPSAAFSPNQPPIHVSSPRSLVTRPAITLPGHVVTRLARFGEVRWTVALAGAEHTVMPMGALGSAVGSSPPGSTSTRAVHVITRRAMAARARPGAVGAVGARGAGVRARGALPASTAAAGARERVTGNSLRASAPATRRKRLGASAKGWFTRTT